jgi:hypothetical protein
LGENDGELSFEPNQIITNGKFLLLLLNLKEMVIPGIYDSYYRGHLSVPEEKELLFHN